MKFKVFKGDSGIGQQNKSLSFPMHFIFGSISADVQLSHLTLITPLSIMNKLISKLCIRKAALQLEYVTWEKNRYPS